MYLYKTNVYTAGVNKGYYVNWIPVENKHQVHSQLYLVFTQNNWVYTTVIYSQNLMVVISSLTQSIQGFVMIMLQIIGQEYIHNVYELPSIEPAIRYLHAAAGFPVEETWLKAIRGWNYNSWPLIKITNVARYFPKSEEMQKGHMRGQRQGVRSTKKKTLDVIPDTPAPPPHESKRDIFICIYKLKKTRMYSNQMGHFPQVFSLGNNTSWPLLMLTATLCGQRPSRTTPAANLSWPVHEPWSKCKRQALSRNTKSWTTKHQG